MAIARWLRLEYPAIAREAKRAGAAIYWGDAMGLRSDHIAGTRYAPMGQTPIVRATGQRFGCNMISAISNRGQLAFMVFHGSRAEGVGLLGAGRLAVRLKNCGTTLIKVRGEGLGLRSKRLKLCKSDVFVLVHVSNYLTREHGSVPALKNVHY